MVKPISHASRDALHLPDSQPTRTSTANVFQREAAKPARRPKTTERRRKKIANSTEQQHYTTATITTNRACSVCVPFQFLSPNILLFLRILKLLHVHLFSLESNFVQSIHVLTSKFVCTRSCAVPILCPINTRLVLHTATSFKTTRLWLPDGQNSLHLVAND